nr:alkaline phosphatase family protein [Aeromicrobium stalagmiti]
MMGGCAFDGSRTIDDPTVTVPPAASSTPQPTSAAAPVDKVMVIILENHSAGQITSGAPRLTALAARYGTAPNALAPCGHPSQPNYVCLSTGGKYLSTNDVTTLKQPDMWNNTLSTGRTMKVYADNLPSRTEDRRRNVGTYAPRHVFTVPFVSTPAKQANFAKFTVDAQTLSVDVAQGALPHVGALVPDNCHNAHDRCETEGSTQIKQADDWIADQVALLQSGPDWADGHLLIVVTADEDNSLGANDIPMIVVHPALSHVVTDVALNLYSLGGLLADVGHTARLGEQRTAPDFAQALGLSIRPAT